VTAVATYDLIAIGSGPAGRCAAVEAAKLGKRAAVVEREAIGGVSTNVGTVPSKTLRAAVVELTGQGHGLYRNAYRARRELTTDDLFWRTYQVIEHEREAIHDDLRRNSVDVIAGSASFVDPHTLRVDAAGGQRLLQSERLVIAAGTRPVRPVAIDFDDRTVLDSNGILRLSELPRTLTVIGGGVIGLEYASMAAALGVRVTLVERRARLLGFVDWQLVEALQYHLRGRGVVFRLGEEAVAVERQVGGRAVTCLLGGERLSSEVVLHAGGRRGATDELNLEAAGLEADAHGRIAVERDYRTAQPHIFAVGDVTGLSRLASTATEQGRRAARAAFGHASAGDGVLPFAIYTIPELSFAGRSEPELIAEGVPFVAGVARYRELPRGEIAGDRSGLLKLLVHTQSRRVLGVHILGTSATELVHLGQLAITAGLEVDYFAHAVFNAPTFADAYKVAAVDAADRLAALCPDDAVRAA
jgi:NAD(P) transhydrogenase